MIRRMGRLGFGLTAGFGTGGKVPPPRFYCRTAGGGQELFLTSDGEPLILERRKAQ